MIINYTRKKYLVLYRSIVDRGTDVDFLPNQLKLKLFNTFFLKAYYFSNTTFYLSLIFTQYSEKFLHENM